MFRATAVVTMMLTCTGTVAAAAEPQQGSGSVATAIPALAADVDWSLPAIHVESASRGSVLPSLYASLAGLQAFDGYSTLVGVRRGAVETNGIIKNVAGNPAALWAVKAGATTASIFVAERLWKQNRRMAAIATMVATNGLMAAVAARNASVLRAQR